MLKLPVTPYKEHLDFLINLIKELGIYELCRPVLSCPKFQIWSGSAHPDVHHYGIGGLLIHTYEVVRYCHEIAITSGQAICLKTLITSAI